MPAPRGTSLRERKRLAAMHRIQTVALELFEREGFDAVTVEQIARDAEVSPSSIYRWFGTKEALVIWDEWDPGALAQLERLLVEMGPREALRAVVRATVGAAYGQDPERIRRRLRLAYRTPSLEAASTLSAYRMADMIAGMLRASGKAEDDLAIEVMAHAFVGGLLGALRHWHDSGFTTPVEVIADAALRPLDGL